MYIIKDFCLYPKAKQQNPKTLKLNNKDIKPLNKLDKRCKQTPIQRYIQMAAKHIKRCSTYLSYNWKFAPFDHCGNYSEQYCVIYLKVGK